MGPDRETLRADLRALDTRQQKIVGAMVGVLVRNPARAREREWVVEQFTHVVLLAGDLEHVENAEQGVEAVRSYVAANLDRLLNAAFGLFLRVAEDLADLDPDRRTPEAAMERALAYLAPSLDHS